MAAAVIAVSAMREAPEPVEWVLVDASPMNWIDATAIQRLRAAEPAERGLTLGVARAKLSLGHALDPGWVAQRLASTGLRRSPTLEAAMNAFLKRKLAGPPPGRNEDFTPRTPPSR